MFVFEAYMKTHMRGACDKILISVTRTRESKEKMRGKEREKGKEIVSDGRRKKERKEERERDRMSE